MNTKTKFHFDETGKTIYSNVAFDGFEGYAVPDNIKKIATAICDRFIIYGECDPMYIANVIAHENGGGDGEGHFSQADFEINPSKTAKAIQSCYGHNITPEDLAELIGIIVFDGDVELKAACKGLAVFTGRLRAEFNQSSDQWRKDYLSQLILLAEKQANYYSDKMWSEDKPPRIADQIKEAGEKAAKHNAERTAPPKNKDKNAEL